MSKKKRNRTKSSSTPPTSPAPKIAPAESVAWRRYGWLGLGAIVVLVLAAIAYSRWIETRNPLQAAVDAASAPSIAAATFVGAPSCAGCHAKENVAWQNSQHAKAMQHATAATVLGDFSNAQFTYDGIVTTFFQRDGKFFVNTDGADGKLADFEILYTFGLYPLQQYLVAFPDGRMQALSIAWDARPKNEGGGRWYHLYPNDHITYTDPLHWTRLNQNWNWMCANCHTTKLDRNYDAATNSYATTWKEMNVACEACHGPGSNHIAWAKHDPGYSKLPDQGLVVALNERQGISWAPVAATGNSVRSAPLSTQRELATCAQCHSRRVSFGPGMDHDGKFFDTHELALLSVPLYFDDGQQRDEVYDVGSFLQSKMHAHGVTCSDCHDPHSGQLRAPGNAVCAQCHSAAKYAVPKHTLHAADSTGAQCAACHMPPRNYMLIDPRHDHSIRIPRPDLSAKLDTPNACTDCHKNRSPGWAAAIIEKAFGPERKGFQAFGTSLHDGRIGAPGAAAQLMTLAQDGQTPAIVRATALAELRPYLGAAVMPAIEAGLADSDSLVRSAALDMLLAAPQQERIRLALGLIDDPSLIVRIKAARVLAIMPAQGGDAAMRAQLDKGFAEYVASQQANADRPESHVNLGLFYFERRDPKGSEAEYRAALAVQSDFIPAYVNLADLYRTYNREADAETTLAEGLQKAPGNADLSHALGLLRIRQKRASEALPLLEAATRADPNNARYAYVYGVALHDSGQAKAGIASLEKALARFPRNPNLLSALAAYAQAAGDSKRAEAYSKRLAEIAPPSSPTDPSP
jgi:predicted CXXCH cytochrome family protein